MNQSEKNQMWTYRAIAIAALIMIFVIIVGKFLKWSDGHDQEVEQNADAYTKCVEVQFGMTPAAYEYQYNALPDCSN